GQILPGAADAFYFGLTAKFSFGSDFSGNADDFRGEGTELIHHRVDGFRSPQELACQMPAFNFEVHGLGQVALRDCAYNTRHVSNGLYEIADKAVDGIDTIGPTAGGTR